MVVRTVVVAVVHIVWHGCSCRCSRHGRRFGRYDVARSEPGCEETIPFREDYCGYGNVAGCVPIDGCGAGSLAFAYFYSLTLLLTLVFVNLFIAVILEGFGQCQQTEKEAALHRREKESRESHTRHLPIESEEAVEMAQI